MKTPISDFQRGGGRWTRLRASVATSKKRVLLSVWREMRLRRQV